ncbi:MULTISPECIES: RICIN domain-containing protein [Actinomycetes]|uniref:RICIN domain-containing protein n=1 Tax=Actinomycetes TaxID=1760 RepID=UPI0001B55A1C|nr:MULTISPECIES: RICIN domain-containing protein [Actinomycetes]
MPQPDGTLADRNSSLCLDTKDVGTAVGTPLVIRRCIGSASQKWQPGDSQPS